ncbi:unnamed protein product [Trichobilharzia regenti]|nr:unnamed protein product [Trichobilharzia regenti]
MSAYYRITDIDAVCDVIGRLENFPMTMNQLQDTRIGQLLQTIRHKVDIPLQKRIRLVIKAWQKLLSPDFSHPFVIPSKASDKSVNTPLKSNGTPTKPHVHETSMLSTNAMKTSLPSQLKRPDIVSSNEACVRSTKRNLPDDSPDKTCDKTASKPRACQTQHSDNHNFNESKRQKSVDLSLPPRSVSKLSHNNSPSVKILNGTRGTEPQDSRSQSNSDSPVSQLCTSATSRLPPLQSLCKPRVINSARLSKVKSTAELVQEAGDCIDSATADRILTNRISKEVDPSRVSSLTQPTKLHLSRTSSGPHQTSCNITVNNNEVTPLPKSSTFSDSKSHIEPEFIETSALIDKSRIPVSDSFGMTSHSGVTQTVAHDQNPLFTKNNENISNQPLIMNVNSEIQDSQKVKKKKKHKHHKHHSDILDESFGSHSKKSENWEEYRKHMPPVTNFMDDWPELPSLPAEIDFNSLDSSYVTTCDSTFSNNKEHTLSPKRRTKGTELDFISPTEVHSVSLGDQYLHILPWVDMIGYRRQFFPSSSDRELDELIKLPEPW